MKKLVLFAVILLGVQYFGSCQVIKLKGLGNSGSGNTNSNNVSNADMVSALKEALTQGINKGADKVSATDGFFKNMAIKILMPEEAKNVETKLRQLGMGSLVDNAILSMNRAAEQAAKDSKPIFVSAIKNMTITDAVSILKGPDNAATNYLRTNTSSQLTEKFTPVIKKALDNTQATKYWTDVFTNYNKIPGVQKVNTDLTKYVTQKALDGLFKMIADEEFAIRKDPIARTSDILKKVFGMNW
jgi:hypothetical protein